MTAQAQRNKMRLKDAQAAYDREYEYRRSQGWDEESAYAYACMKEEEVFINWKH